MIDLIQALIGGHLLEAHGKKWVTLYLVSSNETHLHYLASEADAPFPCEVRLIRISKEDEKAQLRAYFEALKQQRKNDESP